MNVDPAKDFDYENGFYLTAAPQRLAKFANHLDFYRMIMPLGGDIIECGVFKGASLSRFIKFRAQFEQPSRRRIVGLDVFGAFPEATLDIEKDCRDRFVAQAGMQGISRDAFQDQLRRAGLADNVDLVAGDVRTTAPAFVAASPGLAIALLNIDVDLYEPTRACLEAFFPCLVTDGIAILDDYDSFPGAKQAVDEFLSGLKIPVERLPYAGAIPFIRKPAATA